MRQADMTPAVTYRVHLWDHAPRADEPYDYPENWSLKLAATHIDGPSTGLSIHDVRRALRKLLGVWSHDTILLERESGLFAPNEGSK